MVIKYFHNRGPDLFFVDKTWFLLKYSLPILQRMNQSIIQQLGQSRVVRRKPTSSHNVLPAKDRGRAGQSLPCFITRNETQSPSCLELPVLWLLASSCQFIIGQQSAFNCRVPGFDLKNNILPNAWSRPYSLWLLASGYHGLCMCL